MSETEDHIRVFIEGESWSALFYSNATNREITREYASRRNSQDHNYIDRVVSISRNHGPMEDWLVEMIIKPYYEVSILTKKR